MHIRPHAFPASVQVQFNNVLPRRSENSKQLQQSGFGCPIVLKSCSCVKLFPCFGQLSNLCKYTQERGAGDQAANLLLVLCLDSRYGLLPPKEPSAEDQVWRYKQVTHVAYLDFVHILKDVK